MRNGICNKCRGQRVGRVHGEQRIILHAPSRTSPHGHEIAGDEYEMLRQVFVCADCGYEERFITNTADIPFDKLDPESWSWVSNQPSGPYR